MPKVRLDLLLTTRGLAESRSKAQALIMAARVRLNGQLATRPAEAVNEDAEVVVDAPPRFVSRGGDKLQAALESFPVDPAGRICADIGASTGGFTDCLLQHGAARVYAIDVGKGILHWKLRSDARVVVMEETNARFVSALPEAVQLVTCDASFISLRILLPVLRGWFGQSMAGWDVIALIKPQFEAGRADSARNKGVIRDPQVHRRVLEEVLTFACQAGFGLRGLARSPVLGPKGNVEFLAWLGPQQAGNAQADDLIARVLAEAQPD